MTAGARGSICVLSSSSRGNCTALMVSSGGTRRLYLIDAGLSPRRTRTFLAEVGAGDVPVAGVLLTHLDCDHWNPGWLRGLPDDAPLFMARSHLGRARREGVLYRRCEPFHEDFSPGPGVSVSPIIVSHDSMGVASFRIRVGGAELGFATDVGRPSDELARHLSGVDVLAIESNYCPVMQEHSGRPAFLKRRITGGAGHLSNQQSAALTRRISPGRAAVLLHLSPQCNLESLARREHEPAPYEVIVSRMDRPTPWIDLVPGERRGPAPEIKPFQASLFPAQ